MFPPRNRYEDLVQVPFPVNGLYTHLRSNLVSSVFGFSFFLLTIHVNPSISEAVIVLKGEESHRLLFLLLTESNSHRVCIVLLVTWASLTRMTLFRIEVPLGSPDCRRQVYPVTVSVTLVSSDTYSIPLPTEVSTDIPVFYNFWSKRMAVETGTSQLVYVLDL